MGAPLRFFGKLYRLGLDLARTLLQNNGIDNSNKRERLP